MRILLSYPSETDRGEGQFFHSVLERLGHTVTVANAARANPKDEHVSRRTVSGFSEFISFDELLAVCGPLDLFLYVEPLGVIPWGIERAPFPTACIIGDAHRSLAPRVRLARFFDHVFLYQRNYLDAFREHAPGRVHWQPYACDLAVFRDLGLPRDLDVAFIGNLDGRRRAIMTGLAGRWRMNEHRYYLQADIPEVYSRAKVVVNLPVGADLNFRFFETLSCGALLITLETASGQEQLFKEGEHYVGFTHERELVDKVAYYLENEAERRAIAEAGHRELVSRHGLDTRLIGLVEKVTADPAPAAPIRRMSRSEVDREYAWLYAFWASVEPSLALVHEAKRAGRPWIPLAITASKTFARRLYRAVR